MFDKIKKIYKLILASALLAGAVSCLCGFAFTLPKGVTVNGVEVGGLTYKTAAELVRNNIAEELKTRSLTVKGEKDTYTFRYPEINYRDNLFSLLKCAKKGDNLTCTVSYYLCGINDIARAICLNERTEVREPCATFNKSGEPFTYDVGNDGKEADEKKLIADLKASLSGDFTPVTLAYTGVNRKTTLESVKNSTKLLASFTTCFDGNNLTRVSNIRLAASKLNGSIVQSGKTLSFNDTVGERVKSRGFLPAKIIVNGEFTEGIGGGVCQVSTTLYNCALLAGFSIEEYHPHSLSVSYVPPSRDAMVSGSSCDLKIKNNSGCPAYIRATTGKSFVKFEIYGLYGGADYSVTSEVTGTLPAPEESCDSPDKARAGKDGLTSQSYLTVTRDGYTKTTLLRKDKYQPVKGYRYDDPDGEVPPEPDPAEDTDP
ncbi:MAG: VanW family protein [Clostridia bacterium]|nr:VanW family protein [Clostridia bacterium]